MREETVSLEELLQEVGEEFGELVKIIGVEAALKVARGFGGSTICVPKLARLYQKRRDVKIREAFDHGASAKELSRQHDLTLTQIYNILGEKKRVRR